jgi:phosphoenolpyruvate carboxylase
MMLVCTDDTLGTDLWCGLAAPEIEIASLNVGSRPAKRRPTGGVETLRAIPWVFAWTQTRLNLTAWLGIGPALSGLDSSQRETLRNMYENLPWFTAVVDVVDRVIAMTEPDIAANYDKQLVTEQAAAKFVEDTGMDASHDEMVDLGEKLVSLYDKDERCHEHQHVVYRVWNPL